MNESIVVFITIVSATILLVAATVLRARFRVHAGSMARARASERTGSPQPAEADVGRSLAESERRFRSLITATAQAFWTADPDGRMRDSPMWRGLTGQTREEMIGDGWLDAVHPEDRSQAVATWAQSVRETTTFDLEYRIRLRDGAFRWSASRAVPVIDDDGRIVEWVGICTDIHDRRRAQESERFLLEAARVLAASLDLGTTTQAVTGLAVQRFADYCLLYFVQPDGTYRQASAAHVDAGRMPLLRELGRRYRPEPGSSTSLVSRAIATRAPVLVAAAPGDGRGDVAADPNVHRILRELKPASWMIVPLIARDEVIGALVLVSSTSGRVYDEQDLAQAELLGARAALAIDNARHLSEVQEARDRALRAAQLESQLAQARLDTLRAQLNPHFLFNALNTIAMLVRRKAGPDAIRGVVSLSELLRKVLVGTGASEVPLRDELGIIEHYLGIEQLRFGNRLDVRIDAASDTFDALVPSLVLQPLVENAVRHGVSRSPGGGLVEVRCRRTDGSLVINVRDNCIGLPEGWDPETSGGVGLANTRERLQRLYRDRQRFDVTNAPGGGALATIAIPFHTASE